MPAPKMMAVEAAVKLIRLHGPSRVVINMHAYAVSPKRAMVLSGITPDVIFIRGDGWSLGATNEMAMVAYNTWAGDWVGVLVRPGYAVHSVSEWLERDDDA